MAAEAARRDETVAQLVSTQVEKSEAQLRQSIAADRADSEAGYFLLAKRLDQLVRDVSLQMAEVR